jgi:predicted alpha/beta hydrolase family esterase
MTSQAEGIKGDPLDLSNPSLETQAKKWAKSLAVIASENDKWLPRGVQIYGEALQVKPLILPGAGHFSLDDGWGEWSSLIKWIETKDSGLLLSRN